MTEKHLFLVFTNANEDRDDDMRTWYATHVKEAVAEIDGFVSGQRYELSSSQRPGQEAAPWKYLAVYEVEADDLEAVHRSNRDAVRSRVFTPDAGAVAREHVAWVYTPVGERAVAGG